MIERDVPDIRSDTVVNYEGFLYRFPDVKIILFIIIRLIDLYFKIILTFN